MIDSVNILNKITVISVDFNIVNNTAVVVYVALAYLRSSMRKYRRDFYDNLLLRSLYSECGNAAGCCKKISNFSCET